MAGRKERGRSVEACRRTTSLAPINSLRAGRPAAKALASAALALALALSLALALALVLALSLPMPPPWPLLFHSPLTASLSIIQYGSRVSDRQYASFTAQGECCTRQIVATRAFDSEIKSSHHGGTAMLYP